MCSRTRAAAAASCSLSCLALFDIRYSFQYANFPTEPCEVQYISVVGSAASVIASVIFARCLVTCPTLPLIMTLSSLAAAVAMLRLPLVMALMGDFGNAASGVALGSNQSAFSNAATFALFAGYGYVACAVPSEQLLHRMHARTHARPHTTHNTRAHTHGTLAIHLTHSPTHGTHTRHTARSSSSSSSATNMLCHCLLQ